MLALGGRRAGTLGGHARTSAAQLALLAAFGVAAAAFLLALVTVALAQWLGILASLAILAGVSLAGCVGVLIAIRAERRAYQAALARQARDERRAVQLALLTVLPGLRRGGLVAAGLGALALLLAARRDGKGGRD